MAKGHDDKKTGMELWVEEQHRESVAVRFRVQKTLFSERSEYQAVDVVETTGHGRMLLNDGCIMLSERDEFIYHEMIAHVPLFAHPNPKRVLVIGGGDGGTAREVLRHPGVEHCRMVEIDKMVVDACREFVPKTAGDLDHPRLQLDIADGVKFMAETSEKYDVVLIDSTDPIGPAAPLFGKEFYSNVHRVLNDDGIVVAQGESPFYEVPTQQSMLKLMGELFDKATFYNFNNMTYPGGLWSFLFASKGLHPVKDFDADRVRKSDLDFDYYNEDVHRASFSLPNFMRKQLDGLIKL